MAARRRAMEAAAKKLDQEGGSLAQEGSLGEKRRIKHAERGESDDDELKDEGPQLASAEVMASRKFLRVRRPEGHQSATGGAFGGLAKPNAPPALNPVAATSPTPSASSPKAPANPFAANAPKAANPFASAGSGSLKTGGLFANAKTSPALKPTEPVGEAPVSPLPEAEVKNTAAPLAPKPAFGSGFSALKNPFAAAKTTLDSKKPFTSAAAIKSEAAPTVIDLAKANMTKDKAPESTGEEGEERLFESQLRLFQLTEGAWKERGDGVVHINRNSESKTARIIMRAVRVHTTMLNVNLDKFFSITGKAAKHLIFQQTAADADGKPEVRSYLLKAAGQGENKVQEMIIALEANIKKE